ncbi:MAG: hypothetical protein HY700_07200, partial [Gemmatimonadetes bacterium]|nr:hypothetical protein [Gemmatimonadota bacterium]
INNSGMVNWTGTSGLSASDSAKFNNLAGGVVNASAAQAWSRSFTGGTPYFDNQGTFNKTGAGTTTTFTNVPFYNGAATNITSGTLRLNGGGSSTTAFDVASAAALQVSGGYTLTGVSFPNAGLVTIDGGTVTIATGSPTTAKNLALTNGTLTGPGTLTIDSIFTWTSGTISGAGVLDIPTGSVFNIANTTGGISLTTRTINNSGMVNWTGTSGLSASDSAKFNNLAGGVVNASAAQAWSRSFTGGTPYFDNQGTFNKTGAGTTTTFTNVPFTNTGVVDIQSGTLRQSGATLANGAAGTLQGSGTLDVSSGGTIFTNAGAINPGASPGILTIVGGLPMTPATATITIELNGTTLGTDYDRLDISGEASLEGTINVVTNFTPTDGDAFRVLTFGSRKPAVTLASVTGLDLGAGFALDTVFDATGLTLVARVLSLSFTSQPSDTTAGVTLAPLVVTARTSGGQTLTTFNGNVTVDFPGAGTFECFGTCPTLSGTKTVAATNGVATFSDLSIDLYASGYRLAATATGIDGDTSGTFLITPVGMTALWTGSSGTDWSADANWDGGAAPISAGNVFIPASAPVDPALSASVQINDLVVESGASLTTTGFTLTASGDVEAGSTIGGSGTLRMDGTGKTLKGSVPTLQIEGQVSLAGATNVAGKVRVVGPGPNGILDIAGQTMVVSDSFVTDTSGVLVMTNAAGQLTAKDVVFRGGTSAPTNGTITVTGNFVENGSPVGFQTAAGGHVVQISGASTHAITLTNAGARFQNLEILAGATAGPTAGSGVVVVEGNLTVDGTGSVYDAGSDSTSIASNLITQNGGAFRQADANTAIAIGGNALINGGSTAGKLTDGRLWIAGDVQQTGDVASLSADAPHTTYLAGGPTQAILFSNAGTAESHFGRVVIDPSADNTVTINSDVYASDLRISDVAGFGVVHAEITGSHTLTVSDTLWIEGIGNASAHVTVQHARLLGTLTDFGSSPGYAQFAPDTVEFAGPPGQIMPAGDSYRHVVITTDSVTLEGNSTVTGLNIAATARLGISAYTLTDSGSAYAMGSGVTGTGTVKLANNVTDVEVAGTFPNLRVELGAGRRANLTDSTHVAAALIVRGGAVTINGKKLVVIQDAHINGPETNPAGLSFQSGGAAGVVWIGGVLDVTDSAGYYSLVMTHPLDSLYAMGGFYGTGGPSFGNAVNYNLTAGVMYVENQFYTYEFFPDSTGTHKVILAGNGPEMSFYLNDGWIHNLEVTTAGGAPSVTWSVDQHVTGNAVISGDATLSVGSFTISGDLQTVGNGTIDMGASSPTLTVLGNATFAGGDETGKLTSGTLRLSGNFTQSTSSLAFAGGSGFTVELHGTAGQAISFADPGYTASRFGALLDSTIGGDLTLNSDVYVLGSVATPGDGIARTIKGNGYKLLARAASLGSSGAVSLDNARLQIDYDAAQATLLSINNVTFNNFDPAVDQLTISRPGDILPTTFTGLTFNSPPTPNTGAYIRAIDTADNAYPFAITMLSAYPSSAPAGTVKAESASGVTEVPQITW